MAVAMLTISPWAWAQSRQVVSEVRIELDGAFLGIEMEDVTADNVATYKLSSERGVIIRAVEKGSPAEAAGLQAKDVILEYAATPVLSASQMARLVRETPPGRKVDLVVSRDGKKLNLTAKIGQRDRSRGLDERTIQVLPRDLQGRQFEFRGPGGRVFEFRVPPGSGRGFGFAWPWDELGRVTVSEKPRLGVTLQELTDQMGEFLGVPGKKGALVTSVLDGSPAFGKLKAGDVIVRADTRAVEGPDDLIRLVRSKGDGESVELRLIRDKKEMTVAIELPKGSEKKKPTGYRM